MKKHIIDYDIPVQGEEDCEKHNKICRKISGDNFKPIMSTEKHIDILFEKLQDAIEKVGDEGGWYVGDGIRVKIELEYEPEDK